MGILDAPAVDALKRPLGVFDPKRDLPAVLAHYDFSKLTGSDGALISQVPDQSGFGHTLYQTSDAAKPSKQTGEDSKPVARFASLKKLSCSQFGTTWPVPSVPAPVTMSVLVKHSSAETRPASLPVLFGGTATDSPRITVHTGAGIAYLTGRVNANVSGPNLKDDAWHVITAAVDSGSLMLWVDGILASTAAGAVAADYLANIAIDGPMCDIREIIVSQGRLTVAQLAALNTYMASKAPTPPAQAAAPRSAGLWEQTTSANGQAVRVFTPDTPSTPKTLVMWQHPHTQNEQLSPGYWLYPLVNACTARGWYVAASNMHGDSWGNDNAVADMLDLYNLVNGRDAISKVVLVGGSMGGVGSLIAASRGTIPNLKGVYLVDGVCDLANMHANGSYTTTVRTAYGVAGDGSDFATKTALNDPIRQTMSTFAGKRFRFQASTSDTNVPKTAHADAFSTALGATPVENTVFSHALGHLTGIDTLDIVKFIDRSIA